MLIAHLFIKRRSLKFVTEMIVWDEEESEDNSHTIVALLVLRQI